LGVFVVLLFFTGSSVLSVPLSVFLSLSTASSVALSSPTSFPNVKDGTSGSKLSSSFASLFSSSMLSVLSVSVSLFSSSALFIPPTISLILIVSPVFCSDLFSVSLSSASLSACSFLTSLMILASSFSPDLPLPAESLFSGALSFKLFCILLFFAFAAELLLSFPHASSAAGIFEYYKS
jgi:hypothetical protein